MNRFAAHLRVSPYNFGESVAIAHNADSALDPLWLESPLSASFLYFSVSALAPARIGRQMVIPEVTLRVIGYSICGTPEE